MTVMSTLTMATCLVLVGGRQRQDGLGLWGTALLLQALAYSLLALRGQVPDVASIVLANGLLASMYACVLAAIHRFQGRSLPWLWLVLPVMANLALFTAFQDHYPMRVLLAGCLYPLQIARMLWSLYQPGHVPVGRGPLLVALGAVLQVVLLIWRATALPWDQPSAQGGLMRDSGLVQSLTFLSTFISIQVSSLGFIFMAQSVSGASGPPATPMLTLTASSPRAVWHREVAIDWHNWRASASAPASGVSGRITMNSSPP